MALVHSPFEHPPKLEELARKKFTSDLDKKVVAWGHMITYMDDIVGKIMERLKANGLEKNTLVLFTGDNGTHASLVSKLPGMELKGGKGSLTEAGCRVPFMAWWPGVIKPAVNDGFICLVDVLPTICSIAGIGLTSPVDGMDLSHCLLGTEGKDREQILMCFKKGYFVRDKRFRLHEDGTLYDIPVTSDKERYSEKVSTQPEHEAQRQQLQKALDQFRAIPQEYRKQVDGASNDKSKSKSKDKSKKKNKTKDS
jgi:arylsulfatase A